MPFSAAKRYRAPRLRREHSPHIVRPSGTTRLTTLRSEEHTSELQSRSDLVCRLLLEKKKKYKKHTSEVKSRSDIVCRLLLKKINANYRYLLISTDRIDTKLSIQELEQTIQMCTTKSDYWHHSMV